MKVNQKVYPFIILFVANNVCQLFLLQALAEKAEITAAKLVKLKELRALKAKRDLVEA
jgi:hypothetical protein